MFGKRIREVRLANKLSQVELAKCLGLSKQTVSNWETGKEVPSVKMLIKVCQKFSCSVDYLLGLDIKNDSVLDISELTLNQAAHIKQVVEDMVVLNGMLEKC